MGRVIQRGLNKTLLKSNLDSLEMFINKAEKPAIFIEMWNNIFN